MSRLVRATVIALGGLALADAGRVQAAAQGPAPSDAVAIQADPIRCWWRTSAGAVRVGESFSLVLTCAVIENESTRVVPDERELDPMAVQLPPFEVLNGTRPADLRNGNRRFFQYQYTLRLMSDLMFGRDAVLEGVQVPYRIQTRVGNQDWSEGRQYTYFLPDTSVRILSLVPQDATDIRDAATETFSDIDAGVFRADVLLVLSGVLFAFGALMVVLGLVRVLRRGRVGGRTAAGLLSGRAILGHVARELEAIRREREAHGWTSELAGRALAACRIAGSYAVGRPVTQVPSSANGRPSEGQLALRGGWLRRTQVTVSGSVTAGLVAQELTRLAAASGNGSHGNGARLQRLEALQEALSRLTSARYGRDDTLDDEALDASLAAAASLARRLQFEHTGLVMRMASLASSIQLGQRAWPR